MDQRWILSGIPRHGAGIVGTDMVGDIPITIPGITQPSITTTVGTTTVTTTVGVGILTVIITTIGGGKFKNAFSLSMDSEAQRGSIVKFLEIS